MISSINANDLASSLALARPDPKSKLAYKQWQLDCQTVLAVCLLNNRQVNATIFLSLCSRQVEEAEAQIFQAAIGLPGFKENNNKRPRLRNVLGPNV